MDAVAKNSMVGLFAFMLWMTFVGTLSFITCNKRKRKGVIQQTAGGNTTTSGAAANGAQKWSKLDVVFSNQQQPESQKAATAQEKVGKKGKSGEKGDGIAQIDKKPKMGSSKTDSLVARQPEVKMAKRASEILERGPVSKKRGDYKTMNITSIDFDETITKENSS